jgi:hypothetical protein
MKLPQLHLRDLFWLVLICALAAGWWAEHRATWNYFESELKRQGYGMFQGDFGELQVFPVPSPGRLEDCCDGDDNEQPTPAAKAPGVPTPKMP